MSFNCWGYCIQTAVFVIILIMVQPERAENIASTLAVNSGPILLAVTLAIVFICVGLFVLLRLYKNFQKAKQSQNWMTTTG
jgi:hypothetical protein